MKRILIVDDSAFIREQIRKLLETDSELQVVAEARNGEEAVQLVAGLKPDLVLMDVEMPVMDGIVATKRIMQNHPTPIVIHTSSTIVRMRNLPFEAVKSGALDILEKAAVYPLAEADARAFCSRIKNLADVQVFRRTTSPSYDGSFERPVSAPQVVPKVLAIAASTGGPKALSDFFTRLPPVLPFPILLVQHIGASFVEGFAEWLQSMTGLRMKIAEEGEAPADNTCYISPGNIHLAIKPPGLIHLDSSPPVNACRPAADILFRTVSRVYGSAAVGVIMTGIGRDGAEGLRSMHSAGAYTLAQSEESCTVFGMPRSAIELKAVSQVGDIPFITNTITRLFGIN